MAARAFTLPLRRTTQKLFHQQCWCWGADIRHEPDNLLLVYGFTRTRSGGQGGSRYEYVVDSETSVYLWGFGAVYAVTGVGAVFLDRYDGAPMMIDPAGCCAWHWREEVNGYWTPSCSEDVDRCRGLFAGLCRWISRYERWVSAVVGQSHRAEILAEWRSAVTAASDIADEWWQIASQVDAAGQRPLWPIAIPTS